MKAGDLSVLVIEDDACFVQLSNITLSEEGIINMDIALNEKQAIEYSKERDYNLIICDTMNECIEPTGPRTIKRIMEMGKNSVVVALSCDEYNKRYWSEFENVYFFKKGDFWLTYLPHFLKEKFEI